jgi:hypothetical protein
MASAARDASPASHPGGWCPAARLQASAAPQGAARSTGY